MGVQHDSIDHSGLTGVGASLTVENEGTPLATAATTLDFVGAGVTASGAGAEKTITIPGQTTPDIILDFTLGSDINGTALTANTFTDVLANQNFTVASASSLIEIAIRCVSLTTLSASKSVVSRAVIDSGGTPINEMIGGSYASTGFVNANPFSGSGSIFLSGLAAAVHTIKLQVRSTGSDNFFCRPATVPAEFLRIQIIEHF